MEQLDLGSNFPMLAPVVTLLANDYMKQKVKSIIDQLMLTEKQVAIVMNTLLNEMMLGLSRDAEKRKKSSLQMENTYVRSLLNGKEEGDYLSLDLGGTNFRVLLCRMRNGKCESVSKNYNVPPSKLYGPAEEVFDHLAESIFKFLNEEQLLTSNLPLGFTFSFPMVQEGLKRGILVTWTKSFACPNGVGEDAVKMLEDAITRHGNMKVDVVAVLNDTTGTLLAGSYLDKQCAIGLIMGTGCNAAYVENISNVDKWVGDYSKDHPEVVIDIEWGAFGDNGSLDFLKTSFDKEIDLNSNHVGSFTFEKLFAGHYVGDLVRLILMRLVSDGLLFGGVLTEQLSTWASVTAGHVSDVEKDTDDDVANTRVLVKDVGVSDASDGDLSIIRYLCSAVSIRTAQLLSASLAVLLNHMKRAEMTIAIDGSLYRYHPKLHDMMTSWLQYLAPSVKSKLILAEDGSGRGAAFVAAVAVRLRNENI